MTTKSSPDWSAWGSVSPAPDVGALAGISGNGVPPPELQCSPLGTLGNTVAFLAGINNYHRTQHSAQTMEYLAGERADFGFALRLPGYSHLAT